jgi:hypothetical protein
MKTKDKDILEKAAALIKDIQTNLNSARSSSMGYDIIHGMIEGNVDIRLKAWEEWYQSVKNNKGVVEEERNGIFVPAISL